MSLRWGTERLRRREGASPHPHQRWTKDEGVCSSPPENKIQNSCHFVSTCHHFPASLSAPRPQSPPWTALHPLTLFIPDQVFHTAFSENDKCWSPGKILGLICLSCFLNPLCCDHSIRSSQMVGNCSVLIPTMFKAGLDSQLAHNCSLQRGSPPSSAAVQPFSLTP